MQLSTRNKLVTLVIAAVFLIGGLMLITSLSHHGKVLVEVKTAPEEALITINGKKTGEASHLAPGNYKLAVTYEGFKSFSKDFTVTANEGPLTFPVALSATTAKAQQMVKSETARYSEIEGIGGQQAQAASQQFLKDAPLVTNLPYDSGYYRIDYGKDASGGLVIQITASSPLSRQVAIAQIRSWGFDPTDYNLQFIGFANPFGSAKKSGG